MIKITNIDVQNMIQIFNFIPDWLSTVSHIEVTSAQTHGDKNQGRRSAELGSHV